MASSATKSKFVQPQSRPNSDINVTPLVDVVLVLLIIFMVLTPLLEKDIEVKVPETEETQTQDEVPPDQVVVGLTPEGQLTINTEPITEADYVPRLKKIMNAKAKADRLVFFMPDEKANYGRLIAAIDGAKAAGADIIGMMTDPPPAAAPGAPVDPAAAPAAPVTP